MYQILPTDSVFFLVPGKVKGDGIVPCHSKKDISQQIVARPIQAVFQVLSSPSFVRIKVISDHDRFCQMEVRHFQGTVNILESTNFVDVAIWSVIGCSGDMWGRLKVCFPKFKITSIAEPVFLFLFHFNVCGTFFLYEYVIHVYTYCTYYHITIFVFPVFLGSLCVLAAKQARILGAEATPNRSEWQDIGQAWLVQVDAHTGLVKEIWNPWILTSLAISKQGDSAKVPLKGVILCVQ